MTEIWAHRGIHTTFPENSLPAFKEAVQQNLNGIELDLQMTLDQEPVICHDNVFITASNETFAISDLKYHTLKQLQPKNKENFSYTIPHLSEVIELLKPSALTLNIEMKTAQTQMFGLEEITIQLLKDMHFLDRVIFSSFNYQTITRLIQIEPTIKRALLFKYPPKNLWQLVDHYQPIALHPSSIYPFQKTLIKKAHAKKLRVHYWTVNSAFNIRRLISLGADALMTDNPEQVKKILLPKKK